MNSEQFRDGFNRDRSHLCDVRKETLKYAGLQRSMHGYRNAVYRGTWMTQSEVAPFLTDHTITEAFEGAGKALTGHTARQLHAASTGMSSSFT